MNPKVFAVESLDDSLIEVSVGDNPIEPTVEDLLVCVGFVVLPVGVRSLGDVDVGCFAQGVLMNLHSSIKSSRFQCLSLLWMCWFVYKTFID